MDWIGRLNQAIGYIEKNLEGDIDFDEVAHITICPIGLFNDFLCLPQGTHLRNIFAVEDSPVLLRICVLPIKR